MRYHWYHFTGIDHNALDHQKAIYRILGQGKNWAQDVSKENGNYDYLMFANLDYSHPEVKDDVKRWGEWIAGQLPLSGLRIDAVKHYSSSFLKEFIRHLRQTVGGSWFFVGEFWRGRVDELLEYLKQMDYTLSLFDAPLVYRFSEISQTPGADLRTIFDGTLVQHKPQNAVVCVSAFGHMLCGTDVQ
jgi:alpha-amylase